MMMEKIIVLLFLMFSNSQTKAELIPTSVSQMIDKADLIVQGQIKKVIDSYIEVSIIRSVKGKVLKKRIRIEKFQNWICASRYKPYEVGQQELFFLQKNKKNNTWQIMGGGGEGEIPIINKTLYFKSAFPSCCQSTGVGIHQLKNGEKIYGIAFDLEKATKGISLYLQQEKEIKEKFLDLSILNFYPKNKFFLQIINEMICDISRGFTKEELAKRNFNL